MEVDVFEMQSQVDVEPEQQNPIVEATKRGRGGKTVTVIKGLQLRVQSLEALCKSLKVKMGSGGAVKDGEIEIQVCFEIAASRQSFLSSCDVVCILLLV
jgi:predicted translation initiation factor SUI1